MICCSHPCSQPCVCVECGCNKHKQCTGYHARNYERIDMHDPECIAHKHTPISLLARAEAAEKKLKDAIEVLEYASWQFTKLERFNSALYIETVLKEIRK